MSRRMDDSARDWQNKTPKEQGELLAYAKKKIAEGRGWDSVARRLGVAAHTLRRRLDPGFAEVDKAKAKAKRAEDSRVIRTRVDGRGRKSWEATKADSEARLAEAPADTRTLTGILLGDPIFERSALGRRS